jgi:hypothetical protein
MAAHCGWLSAPLRRMMSINEADFFRILPRALAPNVYSTTQNVITAVLKHGSVDIILSPQPDHKLAMLVLPVLTVDIRFKGVSETDQNVFISQFDKSYQRGGG